MVYDRYPAVDDNYDFPPEVRLALSKSAELRNTVPQMTEVERNNLTGTDLWDGRLILNTTTDRINRYDATNTQWLVVAEMTDAVEHMTTATRDNLSGALLFDGRMIVNTDTERIERYDAASTSWKTVGELTDTVEPATNAGAPVIGTADEAARADHVHSGGARIHTQAFTSSGTFTVPTGVTKIRVLAVGGGGGGGGRTLASP